MAENGQDNSNQLKNSAMDTTNLQKDLAGLDFDARLLHEAPMGNVWLSGSRPSSAARDDKEARIKSFKQRQNEDRQRKLEEIKAQALAAQKFKEQKDQERRVRLEECKVKEEIRRQQVEERKRAINDAERDRLESILKRNQQRDARMEMKRRNERSSLVFAFGSSIPRMVSNAETSPSYWGHRRATSTQNITYAAAPLTRRQSERELDGGSKKRATSAGGLERSGEGNLPQHPAGCISGYIGRRRTDLMPTIPSKESPSTPPRKSFTRSPAPSRPSSSLSQQSASSVTSSVNLRSRPIAAPRRPRPASIAITGVSTDLRNGSLDGKMPENKPPLPKTRKSSLGKSQEKVIKKKSLASPTDNSPAAIVSPTSTNAGVVQSPVDNDNKTVVKESVSNVQTKSESNEKIYVEINNRIMEEANTKESEAQVAQLIDISEPTLAIQTNQVFETKLEEIKQINSELTNNQKEDSSIKPIIEDIKPTMEQISENLVNEDQIPKSVKEDTVTKLITESENVLEKSDMQKLIDDKSMIISTMELDFDGAETDMSASALLKPRITTEEEAKAALAERRRIAREEAERQAEQERLRQEEETRLEFERQQREEEQQRVLIEQQRAAEEERLKEAIREAQRREEEEKLKREEEQRLKLLKEEAERKAREEAEKQKAELQERLKNEEKEREARRKRVEAIMLRTRGKNNSGSPQTDEKNAENKLDKINGSNSENAENGHKNGKDLETVDNIITVDSLKNANTVTANTLSTDDTINSNDAWQRNTQTDLLM